MGSGFETTRRMKLAALTGGLAPMGAQSGAAPAKGTAASSVGVGQIQRLDSRLERGGCFRSLVRVTGFFNLAR